MAFMDWDERFSVKVAEIDEQHRQLIGLINELHEAIERNRGRQTVRSAIDEWEAMGSVIDGLVDYTLSHFSMEEGLMLGASYPEYTEHKGHHEAAVNTVNGFKRALKDGETLSSEKIAQFMRDWLRSHILEVDRRLGVFLREKGGN